MRRCADYLEAALKRCGCEVINAQYGNMYDRVKASNAWPADLHIALHTNGFNGKVAGTRVHCYPSEKGGCFRIGSRRCHRGHQNGWWRVRDSMSCVRPPCPPYCRSSASTTTRRKPSG